MVLLNIKRKLDHSLLRNRIYIRENRFIYFNIHDNTDNADPVVVANIVIFNGGGNPGISNGDGLVVHHHHQFSVIIKEYIYYLTVILVII